MLRTSVARATAAASASSRAVVGLRPASTHAISNPMLVDVEKRWEGMPPQEQAELWMALRDRMKGSWQELTPMEKKASYWIAFGPHGPRALPPPDENRKVFMGTLIGIGAACVLFFGIRQLARPPPKTMTREWEEATNEYLKAQKVEPITGISSEGYSGPGYVQSAPAKK